MYTNEKDLEIVFHVYCKPQIAMDKKLIKSLDSNSVNQELLKSILDFSVEESIANTKLIKELVKGENSELITNFNPENHLTQELSKGASVFLISQIAIQDLQFIWTQTQKNATIKDADDLKASLFNSLNKIAQDFTIGKSMENIRDGYRFLKVGKYTIYYRADLADTVEIVRVVS